eukprot:323551-Chlamydomonas_euryale.AAC.2
MFALRQTYVRAVDRQPTERLQNIAGPCGGCTPRMPQLIIVAADLGSRLEAADGRGVRHARQRPRRRHACPRARRARKRLLARRRRRRHRRRRRQRVRLAGRQRRAAG